MTEGQAATLRIIERFIEAKGHSPSFREIADALGTKSLNSVQQRVEALERYGKITRVKHRARSIEIVRAA